MGYIGEVFNNFFTYDLVRTLFVEFFKACTTLLFAYISFRFFQNYKEKNHNNKVHIKILKLNADIKSNIKRIQDILDLYKEGKELHQSLKIEGSGELYYYNIAAKISEILNLYYIDKSYIDFNQELIEVYYFDRYPINYISEIADDIEIIKQDRYDLEELAIAESELNYYEQKDIYIDLNDLCRLITTADKEKILFEFNLKLQEFNNKDIELKNKELNQFCDEMFHKNKIIKEIIEKYKRYNVLVERLLKNDKRENIVLIFNKFSDSEGILAEYNAELYFEIEGILEEYNNKVILLDEKNILEETSKELKEYKKRIDKEIKIIKKKIDSTKRFFGK